MTSLACFSLGTETLGQDYRANLREQCRSLVSDLYISLWNDEKLYREQGEILSKKLSTLRAEQKLIEKNLEELQKQKEQKFADSSWNQKAAGYSYQLDTLTSQLSDLEPLAKQNLTLADERKKQYHDFDQRLRPLFKRVPMAVKAGDQPHALAFRLDYLKECSAYDQLCPLDPSSAKSLETLAQDLPSLAAQMSKQLDAHACQRYSKVRHRSE